MSTRYSLLWLPDRYAVCSMHPGESLPPWLERQLCASIQPTEPSLLCVVRTDEELSLIIDERSLPKNGSDAIRIERGFIAMRVVGRLDFAQVGVMAGFTTALAREGISVLALSTFDTDYLLVRERDRERAVAALQTVADFATAGD